MKFYYQYNTILGTIIIAEDSGCIVRVNTNPDTVGFDCQETELIRTTHSQLEEYFAGERRTFDIPFLFSGTEFQNKVWQALLDIPYGQTRSYKQIAEVINSPRAYRAVGNACNKNNLLIIVPCHRVVGVDNTLTGFALGLDVKQRLINLEADYV